MSTGTSAWAPQTGGGTPQQAGPPQPVPPQPVPPYGWAPPPPASGQPAPPQPGNARPPRLWLWALVTTIITVAAVAATAAITYSITQSAASSAATENTPAPADETPAPTFTSAQADAAKQAVCQAFDVSSKGMQTQGGARLDGQPNLPMLLRKLSGTVSIQNAMAPATPADVAEPAQEVVKTNLDLMNAALGQANIEEVQRATDASNDAIDALVSACGLG